MNRPLREIGPLAVLLCGFLLWSAAFLAIYGAQAIGCGLGWDAKILLGPLSVQRAVLLGLFALVLIGHAALALRLKSGGPVGDPADAETTVFMRTAASRLALMSAAASALCFGGVAWLTTC
ncbi:MAG: hypothetical protein ACK4U0_21290 [Mesorhizobium sp.]